jgi:hypothetical protein
MQGDSTLGQLTDSDWATFMAKLEAAEHEFVQGRPAAFKALWSHGDDVSICGAFGGVESGWDKVASRLDWASSQFSQGTRVERKLDPQSGPTSRTSSRPRIFDSASLAGRKNRRIDPRTAGDDGVSQRSLIPFKKST